MEKQKIVCTLFSCGVTKKTTDKLRAVIFSSLRVLFLFSCSTRKTSLQANQPRKRKYKNDLFPATKNGFFDKSLFFVPLPAFASSSSFPSPSSSFLLPVFVHPHRARPHKHFSLVPIPYCHKEQQHERQHERQHKQLR